MHFEPSAAKWAKQAGTALPRAALQAKTQARPFFAEGYYDGRLWVCIRFATGVAPSTVCIETNQSDHFFPRFGSFFLYRGGWGRQAMEGMLMLILYAQSGGHDAAALSDYQPRYVRLPRHIAPAALVALAVFR